MSTVGNSPLAIPCRVQVEQLVHGRYTDGERPLSWDARTSGIDEVVLVGGQQIRLLSDGGQSCPKHGWVLLLTGGDTIEGYTWTLYGIPKGSEVSEIYHVH